MSDFRASLPLIFGLSAAIGGLFSLGAYAFEFPCIDAFRGVEFSGRGEALIGAARHALQTPDRFIEVFIPFFLITLAVFASPFIFEKTTPARRVTGFSSFIYMLFSVGVLAIMGPRLDCSAEDVPWALFSVIGGVTLAGLAGVTLLGTWLNRR
ncbi:hypothetical protein [uncultured Roseobacter sp.]|uniref:hypothetical protein n=1 Tax=uncultured Roseobacter sp. TaxID=114847 RepID=UPI002638A604|nr:hypothetical protein [uncultured Roseobacter sp.]